MHGAKPNSIKSKLDQLDQIPEGFSYNHAATWQRLEKNLLGEKHKNHRWWLYAAIILLLGGGFLIWKPDVNSNDTINNANKVVKSKKILETQIEILPENLLQNKSVTTETVMHLPEKKPVVQLNKQYTEKILSQDRLKIPVVDTESIAEVIPDLTVDTVNTNVVVKSTKLKFRIAHINELNKPRVISLPSEEKNSTVFKKPLLSSMNEEPLSKEEKTVTRKKSRPIFSPVSSSQ